MPTETYGPIKGFKMIPTRRGSEPILAPTENPRLDRERPVFTTDVEDWMASNQGGLELWSKGITQGLSEAVLGTGEAFSYLLDWEQTYNHIRGAEEDYSNWFADMMKDAKDYIKDDLAHVYQTKAARETFAPGDATWWASNAPTIGTTLALMVPAGGIAGLAGRVGKIAGAGVNASRVIKGVSAAVASRYMENTMEAYQTYESVLQRGGTKLQASRAASEVWNSNSVFILQDIMQYMGLAKVFGAGLKAAGEAATKAASKGALKSIWDISKQIVSEAGEEAGQFIVSEEAQADVLRSDVDFFGRGFGDRLSDYIRDPEFQTAAFFGGIGGGIFQAAGPLASLGVKAVEGAGKVIDDLKERFLPEEYRPSVKRQAIEELAKKRAAAIGDFATVRKLDDISFTRLAMNHLNKGKISQMVEALNHIKEDPKLPAEGKKNIDERINQLGFIAMEANRLKASEIPSNLHEDIILIKLDHIQSAQNYNKVKGEIEEIYADLVKNNLLNPDLRSLKESQINMLAFEQLSKYNPVFQDYYFKLRQIYQQQLQEIQAINPELKESDLVTVHDQQLIHKTSQAQSLKEKIIRIKEDLIEATTPQGLQRLENTLNQEKANKEALKVATNENATLEQLANAFDTTNDETLKAALVKRMTELKEEKKSVNQEKAKEAINEEKKEKAKTKSKRKSKKKESEVVEDLPQEAPVEQDNFPEEPTLPEFPEAEPELTDAPELSPEDFFPESETPEDFDPDDMIDRLLEAQLEKQIDEAIERQAEKSKQKQIVDRVKAEQTPQEAPRTETRNQAIQAQQAPVSVLAHSWLKELAGKWVEKDGQRVFEREEEQGLPVYQKYYDREGNEVPITSIFQTDDNGHLIINTPLVKVGDKVRLVVDNDFPYSTQAGWTPTGEHNYIINIYLTDSRGRRKGKPIAQLPAADGPTATDGDRELRQLVLKSRGQSFLTEITGKNVGDHVRTTPTNSLRVLEQDYYQDEDGNWIFGKTPYKPIMGYVDVHGTIRFPRASEMNGVNDSIMERLSEVPYFDRSNELYPGAQFIARTTPTGSFRIAQIHARKLNEAEIKWIRENLYELFSTGRTEELREVINLSSRSSADVARINNEKVFPRNKIYFVGNDIFFPIKDGWIQIEGKGKFKRDLKNFMEGKPFNFHFYSQTTGQRSVLHNVDNTTTAQYEAIREAFNKVLSDQFKQISARSMNLETGYADPIDPTKTYPSYYDYLVETESVLTDIPGSINGPFEGLSSGYSFHNATIYLHKTISDSGLTRKEEPTAEKPEEDYELPPTPKEPKEPTKEKWEDFDEDPDVFFRRTDDTAPGFERITQKELDWFKRNIGDEFLVVAKGVDRVLVQGVEAFGYFHDGLVTLAELGEVGTTYHEAFHFVVESVLTPEQREKILNAASKYYGIKRGPIEGGPRLRAVDYNLKAADVLSSDKAIQWFKRRDKGNWTGDTFWKKLQQDLQIPKEQIELLKSLDVNNPYNREELLVSLLTNYSYTVEINIAKEFGDFYVEEVDRFDPDQGIDVKAYLVYDKLGRAIKEFDSESEAAKYAQQKGSNTTQYYSNLTVPGGANYTENEIATPAITPSIKGHAQFSTDQGIGWFRSDEATIGQIEFQGEGGSIIDTPGTPTKTRRILEVQSDLFQRGRDIKDLINVERDPVTKEIIGESRAKESKENSFLQLLNKDNNWVTFFVKSIIQDSAKNGYENVLFPTGDTASKVEGHETLEQFKKQKEDSISRLEREKERILVEPQSYKNKFRIKDINGQIEVYKRELERVEKEGFGALRPIYKFYEETVANILRKQGYNPQLITDEYGNTWQQVTIRPEHSQTVRLRASGKVEYQGDLAIWEKLAEDFRMYMLTDGKHKPMPEARNLFQRILTWIKNLIGLRQPIERLFQHISNTPLTEAQKEMVRNFRHSSSTTPLKRLLPNMRMYAQQESAVSASASIVMDIARSAASTAGYSVEEYLSIKDNLDKTLDKLRKVFQDKLNQLLSETNPTKRIAAQIRTLAAMGVPSEEQLEKHPSLRKYMGQWDDVREGFNTITGFRTEVIKALTKYGFIFKQVINEEDEAEDAFEDQAQEEERSKEHIYDLDFLLRNPRESLSLRLKRFLSTIPDFEVDEEGNIVPMKTIFDTPQYIDFNRIYANLASKLANSKDPYQRLGEIAKNSPTLKSVYDRLTAELQSGNYRVFNEFQVKMNMARYELVTINIGRKEGEASAEVIFTDRNSLDRAIRLQWQDNMANIGLIDNQGNVRSEAQKRIAKLVEEFQEFKEDYRTRSKTKDKRYTFADLQAKMEYFLGKLGIEIKPQVWNDIKGRREPKTELERMTFEVRAASLEKVLDMLHTRKQNPFNETTVLHTLSRLSQAYEEDIQAGVVLNEKFKQVNTINNHSYITERLAELQDPITGKEKIAEMMQDPFYNSGDYQNRLLRHLQTEEGRDARLVILSTLKMGKKAKEFEELTPMDSIISRLTAFHYNKSTNPKGFIYLGTLADKSRQMMLSLPKYRGPQARLFLKQVLTDTVHQEAARIRRIKRYKQMTFLEQQSAHEKGFILPTDIYPNADKFLYIPAINNIPNAAEALEDFDPDTLPEINKAIDKAIDDFIADQLGQFYDAMVSNGIITSTHRNISIPEAMVEKEANAAPFLEQFFYNDLAWRIEISKVIHGDLAFYKNAEDYIKRSYQVITPGLKPYINPELREGKGITTLRRIVYKPLQKINSDDYVDMLANLIGGPNAREIAENYRNTNPTDAQSFVTIHAWRDIMIGFGQWNQDHELAYQLAWKKGMSVEARIRSKTNPLSDEQKAQLRKAAADILIQVGKPFQFGDRVIQLPDGEMMVLKEQFKDSFAPLLPDWVNKIPSYRNLRKYMSKHGIHVASAADTVKVGINPEATKADKGFFDTVDLHGVIGDFTTPPPAWKIRELPIHTLRFPQILPEEDKTEITIGTQFWKYIFGNMDLDGESYTYQGKPITGKKLFNIGQKLWVEKVQKATEKFAKTLGLPPTFKFSENPEELGRQLFNLRNVLEQELHSRSMHDNYFDALQIIVDDLNQPTFNISLDFPALGVRFMRIMSNMFRKKIIRAKSPGFAKVNVADIAIKEDERLSFIKDEDGRVVEAEVGMYIPDFKSLGIPATAYDVSTGKLRWEALTEIQRDALRMILYRIPTSGKNSMLPIRVVRILPKTSGSMIIIPGETTKQAGLDFDFDKSFIMSRVRKYRKEKVESEGKKFTRRIYEGIDPDNIDNKIFDVAWSILQSKHHAYELLLPIDNTLHADMVKELSETKDPLKDGNIIDASSTTSPFSIVYDLYAEKVNKHAKRQIGIFSRFSTGHAQLQHIKDIVKVNVPVHIQVGDKPMFNKVGEKFDNEGKLISDNHSTLQQSALNAAKDPVLGKLNILLINSPAAAYMTDLGVSQRLVIYFMNQPIMRELISEFEKSGGEYISNGIDALLAKYPKISTAYRDAKSSRIATITPENLKSGLSIPIDQNIKHQAQILADYEKYHQAGIDMGMVNNVLSVDTIADMTGIEAIEHFQNQVKRVSNPEASVFIPRYVFEDVDKSPLKRVAAYHVYAIEGAKQFLQQFYPHTSTAYTNVKDELARRLGKLTLDRKEQIQLVNNFLSYYAFITHGGVANKIIGEVASGHQSRWGYFDKEKNIKRYVDRIIDKFKDVKIISQNPFIQALRLDKYSRDVQGIEISTTHSNYNKTRIIQGWRDLLNVPDPPNESGKFAEVRQMARDIIAFAIRTSGMQFSTGSFYELIPVDFWVETGLARFQRILSKGLRGIEGTSAVQLDVDGAIRSFIRHNFTEENLVPIIVYKEENAAASGITDVKKGAFPTHIKSFRKRHQDGQQASMYYRMYDFRSRTWRLYEQHSLDETFYYEIQPLGEPGQFYEVEASGLVASKHPSNFNHGIIERRSVFEPSRGFNINVQGINRGVLAKYGLARVDTGTGQYSLQNIDSASLLKRIIDNEPDVEIKAIAKRIEEYVGRTIVPVTGTIIGRNTGGTYIHKEPDSRIELDIRLSNNEDLLRRTGLHEILHSISVEVINNPTTEKERDFVRTLDKLRTDAIKRLGERYELSNNDEFLVALGSDPDFRRALRKSEGWWNRLIRAIRRLFGLTDKYDRVISNLYDVLDSANLSPTSIEERVFKRLIQDPFKETGKKVSLFERILNHLEQRVTNLQRIGDDATAQMISSKLGDLSKLRTDQLMVRYISMAGDQVEELASRLRNMYLTPEDVNPVQLRGALEQALSYKLLEDIRTAIRSDKTSETLKNNREALIKEIDNILSRVRSITQDIMDAVRDRVAYVTKQEITEDITIEDLRSMIEHTDRDISIVNRGLDPIVESVDPFLRALGKMVTRAFGRAKRLTHSLLYKQDPDDVVLNWHGNKIRFKDHGYATMIVEYEKWLKRKGININNVLEKNKFILNQTTVPALNPSYDKVYEDRDIDGINFINPLSAEGKKILSIPEGHEDYPLRMYYETVVLGYLKEQESIRPKYMRPELRIPTIGRTIMEAITREPGDRLHIFKEKALDAIRRRFDETDYQQVDEAGRPIDFVPVRYISKQDGLGGRLSAREVSLDVAATVFHFRAEVKKRTELLKILADAELIKEGLATRTVAKTRRKPGFFGMFTPEREAIVDQNGNAQTKNGTESNAYLHANTFMRRMLYGKMKKDEGSVNIFGIKGDVGKIFDSLTRYTGVVKLSLNLGIAATNLGVGELTAVKEAIGGNIFTLKDWWYGKKMYAKTVMEALADVGKRNKQNKISRVYNYFDPVDQESYQGDHLGINTNRVKALAGIEILSAPNRIAEYELSSSLMFTIFNQYPVVGPDGKVVKLYDALEPQRDGSMKLKAGHKLQNGKEFDDLMVEEIKQRIVKTYQLMNGIYNILDQPGIKETSWGRLVLLMRSWLKPGIDTRWRLKHYSEKLRQVNEGHYISTAIFLRNAFAEGGFINGTLKALRYLSMLGANPEHLLTPLEEKLSPEEKEQLIALRQANLRKTLFEMYVILGTTLLMMFAWDDDDKDSYTLMLLARMRRELMTFFSPSTAWDVLRSPTVVMGSLEGFGKTVYTLTLGLASGEALDVYEQGPRKGETKIEAAIKDMIPIWSQRNQFEDMERRVRLIQRGWR